MQSSHGVSGSLPTSTVAPLLVPGVRHMAAQVGLHTWPGSWLSMSTACPFQVQVKVLVLHSTAVCLHVRQAALGHRPAVLYLLGIRQVLCDPGTAVSA